LGPQSGSRSLNENIATGTSVHPTRDSFISQQNPVLANNLETGRYSVDEIHTVALKSTNATLLLTEVAEDEIKKNSDVTDRTSAIIEVKYTAEQVSHHPPGMLQQEHLQYERAHDYCYNFCVRLNLQLLFF
jgi:hypothetical protein